jgi:cytochrome c oxidase cbb3-type subunit III
MTLAIAPFACSKKPVEARRENLPLASGSMSATTPPSASVMLAISQANARKTREGEAIFGKYCSLCHGYNAEGYAADNAPSLVSATFLATATDDFLRDSIRTGRPGTAMAGYGESIGGPLTDSDVASILLFLRKKGGPARPLPSYPGAPGDATRGATIYEETCQRCHGTKQERGNAVHLANPTFLAMANDAFLRHAIVNGRPGTPMVGFGEKLAPQQIDDVLAYVRSFAPPPDPPAERPPSSPPSGVPELPKDLPLIINPRGAQASFTLRDDRFLPADDVKKALDAKQRMVIIDARAASDWIRMHIPGSIPVPYYDMAKLDKLPKDGTWIIAYCACPHHASGAVVDELRRKGFPHTAVLDEGILVWQQRGYPVVPGPGAPPIPPVGSAPAVGSAAPKKK